MYSSFHQDFVLWEQFTAKLRGRPRGFLYCPCPHTDIGSPIINISSQTVRLLTVGEPGWMHHYQSPQFTFEFTLGAARPTALDRCMQTHIHHYGVVSIFTTPKAFCSPPSHLPTLLVPTLPKNPGNHSSCYCLHSYAVFYFKICMNSNR